MNDARHGTRVPLTRRHFMAGTAAAATLGFPAIVQSQPKEIVIGGAASHKAFMDPTVIPMFEKKYGCKVIFEGTKSLVNLEKMVSNKSKPYLSVVMMDDPVLILAVKEDVIEKTTAAKVVFSITSSLTARMSTGSSIITTERYGFDLFETIFSRFTSDFVPSKMTLQPYFFSNIGMTVGSMNALWLAAPPMTISFGWLCTMAGNPSVAAAAVPAMKCRRVRGTRVPCRASFISSS